MTWSESRVSPLDSPQGGVVFAHVGGKQEMGFQSTSVQAHTFLYRTVPEWFPMSTDFFSFLISLVFIFLTGEIVDDGMYSYRIDVVLHVCTSSTMGTHPGGGPDSFPSFLS
ncbi:hypothetical protein BDV37DRAFT_266868 [Aspergillus pseudonomiae]|uniref:Uncharacterized protein n=1 Tax=Aspergillus pseudonomiae TaxID=1506151 RepID=A0A5N7CSA2_9EURO|nr:uncharacterized protein BDV37DRAFT_266868 [Aspergillus pseudonomiae]KAE8397025.1 hypothetical protein BDV37DRAFT_266868 [Aspergillus pseudonomiae]